MTDLSLVVKMWSTHKSGPQKPLPPEANPCGIQQSFGNMGKTSTWTALLCPAMLPILLSRVPNCYTGFSICSAMETHSLSALASIAGEKIAIFLNSRCLGWFPPWGDHLWENESGAALLLWKNSHSDGNVTAVLPPRLRYPGWGSSGVGQTWGTALLKWLYFSLWIQLQPIILRKKILGFSFVSHDSHFSK